MKSKDMRHLFVVLSVIFLIIACSGKLPSYAFGDNGTEVQSIGCSDEVPEGFEVYKSKARSGGENNRIEFKTVYPGVYDKDEQELIDIMKEYFSGDSKELAEKIKAQNAGKKLTGKLRGKEQEINASLFSGIAFLKNGLTEYTFGTGDLLYTAYLINPLNPLYTDPEYSKKAKGGHIAAPLTAETSPVFPHFPTKGEAVSIFVYADDPAIGRGLDHELTFHKPIYAGDTIHGSITEQSFTDITDPNGSKIRRIRFIGKMELYNQKDELVASGVYSAIESFKHFKDPSMAAEYDKPLYIYWPRYYDWDKMRPRHVYTEADWDYIKDLWSKEYIRGSETLYWEDVNIGDEPAWICGYIFDRGSGDNILNIRKSETARDILMDNNAGDIQAGLYKNEYGEYHLKKDEGQMREDPALYDHPNARSSFMNTVGRNYATRLVTNWMGDDGWLHKIAWRLAFCLDEGRNQFPAEHDRPSYLLKVPYLKEQGKFMNTHGYEGDIGITKGYVCDKYVEDGVHYVDLVVWSETIEGDIWAECYAVVELPSR